MGVSRDGTIYLAWEDTSYTGITRIRFAQCIAGCMAADGWQVFTLASDYTAFLESDRDLVVDDTGRVHLIAQPRLQRRYFTCDGNCTLASSWNSIQLDDFSCEHSSLATGSGIVGVACVRQGAVKIYECFADDDCTASGSWNVVAVSRNALPFSQISLSYDGARPRLAWFDDGNAPNIWTCTGACAASSDWSGVRFASAQASTSIGGLHLTVAETGDSYLTTAVDGSVQVRRCSAASGSSCWVPGSAWQSVGTVETAQQAASTSRLQSQCAREPSKASRSCGIAMNQSWSRLMVRRSC